MQKAHGLRRYFYEYVFAATIDQTREATAEIIPISQAKAIRADVDARLSQVGTSMADPQLGITNFLRSVDEAMAASVRDYEPVFGDHSPTNETYLRRQREFATFTGVGVAVDPGTARLPISPYDPDWSMRATVRRAGTELRWIPDSTIEAVADGQVSALSDPRRGNMMLYRVEDGTATEAGRAMTLDDASGLTALMDAMSEREYEDVRGWVIDGGRDPGSGRIDPSRFCSPRAVARSVAVLAELRSEGVTYRVERDREPGQIKAKVADSGMEIRLLDPGAENFAGARIYDDGVVTRFTSKHRQRGRYIIPSPSPADAVRLVRYARGLPVARTDDPERMIGDPDSTHPERVGRAIRQVPDAYHSDARLMAVAGDLDVPTRPGQPTPKLLIRSEARRRSRAAFFVDAEAAEEYVQAAVGSARENFVSALAVEDLIAAAERRSSALADGLEVDELQEPDFSADPEIEAIQRSYWDVLTGQRSALLRPGASEEMYRQRLESIGESDVDLIQGLGNLVYAGSPAETVREHSQEAVMELLGTAEVSTHVVDGELVDQRFDAGRVAKFMTSPEGQWQNLDSLGVALRTMEVEPSQMLGNGFQATRFKDRLVRFDPDTAVPTAEHPDPLVAEMGQVVTESIQRSGGRVTSVLVDENGVISWSGSRVRMNGTNTPVSGQIGQVFPVGEHGEIITRFASGENGLIVPGHEARIVAQNPGTSPVSVEERTRLRGYRQMMHEKIQQQIALDLASERSVVGEPASLNSVYPRLYGTRHPEDFIEAHTREGVLDEWTASILATEAARVRYGNEIKSGSTIYAEYRAQREEPDLADDNHFDAWRLTGGRNMAVLTAGGTGISKAPGGYFDPMMTGGAMNQGIVRYLTADAVVASDGRITPGDPETLTGSRAELMTRPELATMAYDPFDRQQMTTSTIMQSSEVTEPTGTALMTFGGWTADDPIVVSTRFAEGHQIRGAGGQLRDLVVGDKLSDLHGNKGVISLIVDPNMDQEAAREAGIEQEVAWFRANPSIDVVMSPFSLISRRNSGAARELMDGRVEQLHAPIPSGPERMSAEGDGARGAEAPVASTPGGVGTMRFAITHMAVDEKTKIYDEEALREGRGRKASGQLAWALQSQDCPAIMREFYGHNSGAEANLREYLRVAGLHMSPEGTLGIIGQHEELDEASDQRRLFEMPELELMQRANGLVLNQRAMRASFGDLISDRGGDMELPFELTYPTGEPLEKLTSTRTTSWKLPVLSSHLRAGQELDDDTVVSHDHTSRYQDIFIDACLYRDAARRLDDPEVGQAEAARLRRQMSGAQAKAQRSFESITSYAKDRVLTGKNNIFKTGLMSSRLSDSATMVWTGDPRLDIDQVALSSAKAAQLGLVEGDHALIWRDPVLRDAGVRYMRVTLDDRLTGAAINPVMDACFDGDFDGDAVAVVKLHTEAARREAMERLSVPANLLDTGTVEPDGSHPLAMQVSLDTQVAVSKNPELAEELDSLTREANEIECDARALEPEAGMAFVEIDKDRQAGFISEAEWPATVDHWSQTADELRQEIVDRRGDLVGQLSDFYRHAQRDEFGTALRFDDAEAHVRSVIETCVDTGAKGSMGKAETYMSYLGVERDWENQDASGSTPLVDSGRPGITAQDQESSMFATAIKAHGTGLGGSYSQRAVRALRSEDLKAVLEVTYPVTQSILQAKHDAGEARHKYEMLQGPGRDLWRGRKIEQVGVGQWRAEMVDGQPVQATPQEWKKQFIDFYTSPQGFNVKVNPEYVSKVADALTDERTGLVANLEEDPAFGGTVMDRMAYSGTFEDLMDAAKERRMVFEGEKNAQFASAPTRAAISSHQALLAGMDAPGSVIDPESLVSAQVAKSDTLAAAESASRTRRQSRRSRVAVAVGAPVAEQARSRSTFVSSVDEPSNQDEEMTL